MNRFDKFTLDEKVGMLAGLGCCYGNDALFNELRTSLNVPKGTSTGWEPFSSYDKYQEVIKKIKNNSLKNNERYKLYLDLKKEFDNSLKNNERYRLYLEMKKEFES